MRKPFFLLLATGFGLSSLAQSGKFSLRNASGVARQEDPFVIPRETVKSFVSIPEGNEKVPVLSVEGKDIPSQIDDLNGDGKWDELAFQVTMERNAVQAYKIRWVDAAKQPAFPKRTQVWLGVSENRDGKFKPVKKEIRPDWWTPQQQPPRYQMEGPGWENDKVAFRNYFDSRNAMDIFGKTTSRLVLDSVDGSYRDYHKMCPWGMDILKVGPSLGAGAFALVEDGKLFPLQQTESASYREIANGPVRSVLELVYEGWKAGPHTLNVKQRISIWAGKYGYKNEVTLTGLSRSSQLAVGIVNIKNPNPALQQTHTSKYASLATHAKQSENDDLLGMGIMFARAIHKGYGEAPRITPFPKKDTVAHTYYTLLEVRGGEPVEYMFFAGWEKSEARFNNTRYFLDMIQEEADRREYPLKLEVK